MANHPARSVAIAASCRRMRLALPAVLMLCCVLGACTPGFFYNRVDLLVSWYVEGLVSLNEEQAEQLRTSVRATLSWHRETQVPKYIDLLQDIRRDAQAPVTAEMLESRYEEIAALMDPTVERIVPEAAALLRTLSDEQLVELAANLEEDDQDLRKEYSGATPEIRKARRSRNAVRILQRFVGRLTDNQRALVEAHMALLHDNSEAWIERRREWQRQLLALVRDRLPQRQLAAALRDMTLHPDRLDPPEYRRSVEDNRRIVMAMLAEIINGLDARQRGRLTRKLDGYADDLREIAERG